MLSLILETPSKVVKEDNLLQEEEEEEVGDNPLPLQEDNLHQLRDRQIPHSHHQTNHQEEVGNPSQETPIITPLIRAW